MDWIRKHIIWSGPRVRPVRGNVKWWEKAPGKKLGMGTINFTYRQFFRLPFTLVATVSTLPATMAISFGCLQPRRQPRRVRTLDKDGLRITDTPLTTTIPVLTKSLYNYRHYSNLAFSSSPIL